MTTVIYNTFASIINFKRRKRWIYFIILVMLVYMLFYWTSDGEPVFSLESRVKSGVKCKSKVYEISEILDDSAFLLERHSKQDLEDLFFDFLVTVKVQCRDQAHYGPREDGGWEVCMENFYEIKKPCLIYSFGIDHDFRFEKDIEEKLGCEVHAFDPSMEVIDHKYSSNGWYHNLGLGGENGHMVDGTWEVKTLEQIMKDYGHYYSKPIDYLKLDIEFSEWLALPEMIASGILSKVRQIGMEVKKQKNSCCICSIGSLENLATADCDCGGLSGSGSTHERGLIA
ncbi:unnamed protein product [Owenia fusiformis]|uniref:Methyltransferase domain-containing protein n=1 Tax=Owenia fusiformis TaxID=6347 RepID=A0A8S4NZB9_OWEFU|nr:unnamed protein product [Owenia fusiformis]